MTIWFQILLSAVAYAAAARWGLRRWTKPGLAFMVAAGALPLVAANFPLVAHQAPDLGPRLSFLVVVVGATGGCLACAIVMRRLVRGTSVPDPLLETALGAAAFAGGALLAVLVVWFVIAGMMPGIT